MNDNDKSGTLEGYGMYPERIMNEKLRKKLSSIGVKSSTIGVLGWEKIMEPESMYEYFFAPLTRTRTRKDIAPFLTVPGVYQHLNDYGLLFYRYMVAVEMDKGLELQLVILPPSNKKIGTKQNITRMRLVIGPYYMEWTPLSLSYPRPILTRFFQRSLAVITLVNCFDPTKENWLEICSVLADYNRFKGFEWKNFKDIVGVGRIVAVNSHALPKSVMIALKIKWPVQRNTATEIFLKSCENRDIAHEMIIAIGGDRPSIGDNLYILNPHNHCMNSKIVKTRRLMLMNY